MSIGRELRKARIKAGLTQEQLAARARVTREYVNQLEADKSSPTVQVLLRLCRGMDVSAGKLLLRVEHG